MYFVLEVAEEVEMDIQIHLLMEHLAIMEALVEAVDTHLLN